MSDLQPYSSGSTPMSRPARQAVRAISRNRVTAAIRVSAVDADTDVAVSKVENITMATATAMRSVVQLAQLQQALEQLAPAASGRLAYLAEDHALNMGELLADLRHDLRRR